MSRSVLEDALVRALSFCTLFSTLVSVDQSNDNRLPVDYLGTDSPSRPQWPDMVVVIDVDLDVVVTEKRQCQFKKLVSDNVLKTHCPRPPPRQRRRP
jgi:hypothetical protein